MKKTVNAMSQADSSPRHAAAVIGAIRKQGLTIEQIATRAGVSKRHIIYCAKNGFEKFPLQCTLELMAGLR